MGVGVSVKSLAATVHEMEAFSENCQVQELGKYDTTHDKY